MSKIARENPELSEDELQTLMLRVGAPYLNASESRYRYECRSCGDEMWLSQVDHDTREANKASGNGFTIPKCGACWE